MIAAKFTKLRDILQYYPVIESTDKDSVLRNIAAALVEVTGKWDVLCTEFVDDSQMGVLEYNFEDIGMHGLYIEDVLAVTVNGKCLERTGHCRGRENSYFMSQDSSLMTLTTSPDEDIKEGVKVKVKLGVDMLQICQLPQYFFRKFAIHIVNYSIYKDELHRRKERKISSKAHLSQLRQDAIEYFENNECTQDYGDGGAVVMNTNPIRFGTC